MPEVEPEPVPEVEVVAAPATSIALEGGAPVFVPEVVAVAEVTLDVEGVAKPTAGAVG